jgi:hypothetical protein
MEVRAVPGEGRSRHARFEAAFPLMPDGQVEIAIASVRSTQRFPETIQLDKVRALIDAFRRADFFSLKQDYGDGPADRTARTVSTTIDGQTKTVGDHEGQYGGLPDAVMEIEEAIKRAGGLEP